MQTMQQGLELLLDKYSVARSVKLIDDTHAEIDGTAVPLFPWRHERRMIEMKNNVTNGTLGKPSVFRIANVNRTDKKLMDLLYREADLCRWIFDSKIVSIAAFEGKNCMNAIVKLANDVVCTIELANTLSAGVRPVDKHEITTTRGVTADKVVDTQAMQSSIYVLGETQKEYTDVDFELYGMSIEQIATVRAAFAAAKQSDFASAIAEEEELNRVMKLAQASVANCEREDA